jgi:hypothetical protein
VSIQIVGVAQRALDVETEGFYAGDVECHSAILP